MHRSLGLAFAGVTLSIMGTGMVLSAAQAYSTGIPRSPWILYVYVPIGVALLVLGLVLLGRAFYLAIAESKRPPRAIPPKWT